MDVIELNEAFAAQALAVARDLKLPLDVQDLRGIAHSKIPILQPALSNQKVSKFEQWLFSKQTWDALRFVTSTKIETVSPNSLVLVVIL